MKMIREITTVFTVITMFLLLLTNLVVAEEGVVSSYSQVEVESDSGIIHAIAEASVEAWGAAVSALAMVTTDGGRAIAIAYAQISNYGHSVLGVAGSAVEESSNFQIQAQVSGQTAEGRGGQAIVEVHSNEDNGNGQAEVVALVVSNDPPKIVPQKQKIERGFWGYIFGKCDVQRYKWFWHQFYEDNKTENDARAWYNMEIIADTYSNKWGSQAILEFEGRYNITDKNPPESLNGNGDKYGKWCKLPSNGETNGNVTRLDEEFTGFVDEPTKIIT